jgi:hypothetical protein
MPMQYTYFKENKPNVETYWDDLILFGRNTATYKMALAQSLLDCALQEKRNVTVQELAVPFSFHMCEHIATGAKQCTSNSSKYILACKEYLQGNLVLEALHKVTVKEAFKYVFDAFHTLNNVSIPCKFFSVDDTDRKHKTLCLTDNMFHLCHSASPARLYAEIDAQWHKLEYAWDNKIPKSSLSVRYHAQEQKYFVEPTTPLQSSVITYKAEPFNDYQKNKCFYSFDTIASDLLDTSLAYYFPSSLQQYVPSIPFNGAWNIVLESERCKMIQKEKVPMTNYLDRLYRRNETLIKIEHPLFQDLRDVTGDTADKRIRFFDAIDQLAINHLLFRWSIFERDDATF